LRATTSGDGGRCSRTVTCIMMNATTASFCPVGGVGGAVLWLWLWLWLWLRTLLLTLGATMLVGVRPRECVSVRVRVRLYYCHVAPCSSSGAHLLLLSESSVCVCVAVDDGGTGTGAADNHPVCHVALVLLSIFDISVNVQCRRLSSANVACVCVSCCRRHRRSVFLTRSPAECRVKAVVHVL
jgi:hypothetical protein